jgi:hypothetical protein
MWAGTRTKSRFTGPKWDKEKMFNIRIDHFDTPGRRRVKTFLAFIVNTGKLFRIPPLWQKFS